MPAYKDKNKGTWYVSFHYFDWTGKNVRKMKRGFATKKEAQAWEESFLRTKAASMDMTLAEFYTVYEKDVRPKLKENTWWSKEHIIRTKLIPYFGSRKMVDITVRDIIKWQNEMREYRDPAGKPYSPTYLKTVQAQLSCLFNHAVRFYELPSNPVHKAGALGSEDSEEMLFWTKEEYLQFIPTMANEPEERAFKYKKVRSSKNYKKWDRRSTIRLKNYMEEETQNEELEIDVLDDENEIEAYVSQLDTVFDSVRLNSYSQGGRTNLTAEIIAVATFSDDSKAFFSKHYKAYVLDSDNGAVKEVGVTELSEGDSIVFTKNNNDTKDIVDSILRQMILDNKLSERLIDAYGKSKEWQQSLIEYMQENSLTPRKVVGEMLALNVPVQEPTIIRWLDEDAHTVGPRKIDSFKAIGQLTGNAELQSNPELYFEACREVRSIRRRILGEIGRAIINKLSGATASENSEFSEVYEKVDSLAEVLQIERIVPTETVLPLNVSNRPINV